MIGDYLTGHREMSPKSQTFVRMSAAVDRVTGFCTEELAYLQQILRLRASRPRNCKFLGSALPRQIRMGWGFGPVTIFLNGVEARVLGALVEKQTTTPEYYPLS